MLTLCRIYEYPCTVFLPFTAFSVLVDPIDTGFDTTIIYAVIAGVVVLLIVIILAIIVGKKNACGRVLPELFPCSGRHLD